MENNNTQHDNKKLKETVLEKIQSGKVHMRPKFYFFLKVVLLAFIAAIIFITSTLLLSFLIFGIRVSGNFFLLGFGAHGIAAFFLLFPWKTLAVFILLLIILEKVIKKFRFGYRSPLIYLIAGIGGLAIAVGVLITLTSFHSLLLRRAREHRLPVLGDYYMHARRAPREQGLLRGTITSISNNTFVVKTEDESNESTTTSEETLYKTVIMPPDFNVSTILNVGDHVFVAATSTNGDIHAYGIRKILPNEEE